MAVQIPQELYDRICQYFLGPEMDEEDADDLHRLIIAGLREKQEAIERRRLYSAYKTAPKDSAEEARQAYLDRVGMRDAYRWDETEERRRRGID